MPRKRKTNEGAGGQVESAGNGQVKCAAPPSADQIIAEIRTWYRQRCFAMEQRKRLDLALGAFVRMVLGWSKAKPEAERKAIAAQAAELIKDASGSEWEGMIAASKGASLPFEQIEIIAKKNMARLAVQLPVWQAFGEQIRGFGDVSLAVIVAEAGDLSNYPDHSKLWKRMGLAVMDGVRQGGLKKGANKDLWIEHGYNPLRRSRMWNIGDTLIKVNRNGEYRTAYLNRKAYELARAPEMTPMQAHRRAQRYMEKRLLKKLWQAWRRAKDGLAEKPKTIVPAPEIRDAA